MFIFHIVSLFALPTHWLLPSHLSNAERCSLTMYTFIHSMYVPTFALVTWLRNLRYSLHGFQGLVSFFLLKNVKTSGNHDKPQTKSNHKWMRAIRDAFEEWRSDDSSFAFTKILLWLQLVFVIPTNFDSMVKLRGLDTFNVHIIYTCMMLSSFIVNVHLMKIFSNKVSMAYKHSKITYGE
jgi:hypothetical protein